MSEVYSIHISKKGEISFRNNNHRMTIKPKDDCSIYGPSKYYVITIGEQFVSSRKRKIPRDIEFELDSKQIREIANEMLHMDIMRKIKRDGNE